MKVIKNLAILIIPLISILFVYVFGKPFFLNFGYKIHEKIISSYIQEPLMIFLGLSLVLISIIFSLTFLLINNGTAFRTYILRYLFVFTLFYFLYLSPIILVSLLIFYNIEGKDIVIVMSVFSFIGVILINGKQIMKKLYAKVTYYI